MADGQGATAVAVSSADVPWVEGWHVVLRNGLVVYVGTRVLCMRRRDEGEARSPKARWVVSYRVVSR
jgi:hypothetical protein